MKNQYTVSKKRMLEWAAEFHTRPYWLTMFCIWSVMSLGCIGVTVWLAATGKETSAVVLFAVLTLICLYKLLLERFLMASMRYREKSKAFGMGEWTLTVTFSENALTVEEGNETLTYAYADGIHIRENSRMVWLYFQKAGAVRLYKDSFVDGDWEACRALITSDKKPAEEIGGEVKEVE